MAVMYGPSERVTPGNAVAVQADKPFRGLTQFGTSFLSKFEVSQIPNAVLENITFVDTPGVLSGEKQRLGRSYDFVSVTEWFAEKADLILLLFDAHKLDISDEFKRVIVGIKDYDEKIRIVLNKADSIEQQQLMRVYGAMMWSLGKVVNTPEVMRVYIGSFVSGLRLGGRGRHASACERAALSLESCRAVGGQVHERGPFSILPGRAG